MREYNEVRTSETYSDSPDGEEMTERDRGHVREMVAAIDENTKRLLISIEGLSEELRPILSDFLVDSIEEKGAAQPVRCAMADELAVLNDRIFSATETVRRLREKVDL